MGFEFVSVSLDQIETADHTFKITTGADTNDLALSISAIGILHPPVLVLSGKRRYRVVCGFRRIAACAQMNVLQIPARLLPADTPMRMCAQIAISDNTFQRELNVIEKARAYALIQSCSQDSSELLALAHSAGLAGSMAVINRLLPVARMPAKLQNAILVGSIALPIANQIICLNADDAASMCRFFRRITTGLNKQRELFDLISDIAARDEIAIADLLDQQEIASIVADEDCPAPQRVNKLRNVLKNRRYPTLCRAASDFQLKVKSLKLHPRIQLQAPLFFEGKSYRITLSVDSKKQLRAIQPELDKLIQHPSLLPE